MDRIQNELIKSKITSAAEAAKFVENGMVVGVSGFTVVGYPKLVPTEIAKRSDNGEDLKITLIAGGNVGDELDGVLARSHVYDKRYGFQNNKDLRDQINKGETKFVDTHVSHVPFYISNGFFGKIDLAIIEVAGVKEDGRLISSFSVGINNQLAKYADKIILEVNESIPMEIEGMHDILTLERPPHTVPIPVTSPSDRIGTPYIECDPNKVVAVVMSDAHNSNKDLAPADEDQTAIARYIVDFLKAEIKAGRISDPLPPMQSGVGGVANAVLSVLSESDLQNLSVYTEVMQDAVLDLIDAGKVKHACGTALTVSPSKLDSFYKNLSLYKDKIIIRPQEISNSPEVIRRIGSIAMNTAIEVDLAGNVNSTHIGGVKIMNGIGGSGDYARNAGLCVFSTASTAKGGTLSCIVPHVSHVDHTEHDTHIIVTEQGLADLRGLTAYERAELLIEKCAHPKFKDELWNYLKEAKTKAAGFHDIY